MLIRRAYKVELDPNNKQRTAFLQHCGAARWAWNWGLSRRKDVYNETGKSTNAIALHKELNKLKKVSKEEGGIPWAYEVSKCAFQEALRNLDEGFKHFFRRCREGAKKKGYPKYKSKRNGPGSFRLTGAIHVSEDTIKLPRIGVLRLKEHGYLPKSKERPEVKILSATVSEHGGKWFVSLAVTEEIPDPKPNAKAKPVGVDVGIKSLIVLSDGTIVVNPRALRRLEGRLKRLQRQLSRKKRGSNNRLKLKRKLSRLHFRIACIRLDAHHKATTDIVKRFGLIGIESLNVKGMLKNRNLSKALSDAALGELLRQIKYKAHWGGVLVVEAPRFYPSTKKCSCCGNVKDKMPLSERTYCCEECGLVLDRDLNAAINLMKMAVSSTVTACGERSSGRKYTLQVKLPSVKQEPDVRPST